MKSLHGFICFTYMLLLKCLSIILSFLNLNKFPSWDLISFISHPPSASKFAHSIGVYKTSHSKPCFLDIWLNPCTTYYSYSSICHASLICQLWYCDHQLFLQPQNICWMFSLFSFWIIKQPKRQSALN